MAIGWIDFSKEERNKVLNVIHLLDEPGAVDELGIGAVRDSFADYFFPGTSTVQTRAKYFLIVPYVLLEAGSGKYGMDLNSILRKVDDEERKCRDILLKTSSDGVIGRLVPKSWVLRTPSNIYWNGIKRLGIFTEDLSVKEYIQQSIIQRNLKKAKAYGNTENSEENERDDADAGDITSIQFWRLGDTYQKDWRDNLTIDLLPREAAYLKTQIITSQRGRLFAFILQENIPLDKYGSFGALTEDIKESVDSELRYMIELANDCNNLVSLITTRYNLIVSCGENEKARNQWAVYSKDLKRRSEVDVNSIFNRLHIRNPKLKTFLLRTQEELGNGNIAAVDELIIEREAKLKDKSRAKTLRAGEYPKQVWIGIDKLDYRYTPTKRIIQDIMNAEAERHV